MRRAGPLRVAELGRPAARALLRPGRAGRGGQRGGRGNGAATAAAARQLPGLQPGVSQHVGRRRAPLWHVLQHRCQEGRQLLCLIRQPNKKDLSASVSGRPTAAVRLIRQDTGTPFACCSWLGKRQGSWCRAQEPCKKSGSHTNIIQLLLDWTLLYILEAQIGMVKGLCAAVQSLCPSHPSRAGRQYNMHYFGLIIITAATCLPPTL